jgi:two-component system chemotaxis response regulator CheB
MKRDLIVIGGSAGSLTVLTHVLGDLPSDLNAAVCVVVHTSPRGRSQLADILGCRSKLPVANAVDGDVLERGRIYVAPPDRHLLIANGHFHLTRGPKEGLQRPSINVTFRSAAHSRGERVIGLLLSGMLDDGASGLWEIAHHGGVALIQDPNDAEFPSMPLSALQDAPVHHRLRSDEMSSMLQRLVAGEDAANVLTDGDSRSPDQFSGITCPECRGPLFRRDITARLSEFRCRVGHIFSPEVLLAEHTSTQEKKLYEAQLALQEGADLAEYMAARVASDQRERYMEEAAQLRQYAAGIRDMIENRTMPAIEPGS